MHLYFARVLNPKPNHDYIVWAADLQPDGAHRQCADSKMALMCLGTASVAPEHSSLSDTYAASTGAAAFWSEPSALELHIKLVYILKAVVRDRRDFIFPAAASRAARKKNAKFSRKAS